MAERKRLMAKCQELGISVGSKTRLQVIKRRLNDLGVDWTVASTTAPTAPVSNVVNPTSTSNGLDPQQLKQIVDAVVASLQDKDVVKKVELSQSKLEVVSVAVVAQVVMRKKKRTFIWQV